MEGSRLPQRTWRCPSSKAAAPTASPVVVWQWCPQHRLQAGRRRMHRLLQLQAGVPVAWGQQGARTTTCCNPGINLQPQLPLEVVLLLALALVVLSQLQQHQANPQQQLQLRVALRQGQQGQPGQ